MKYTRLRIFCDIFDVFLTGFAVKTKKSGNGSMINQYKYASETTTRGKLNGTKNDMGWEYPYG